MAAVSIQEITENIRQSIDILEINTAWCIIADSDTSLQLAAIELHNFFNQNGMDIPIRTAAEGAQAIELACAYQQGNDQFTIQKNKDGISITGTNPRSILYGAYRLINWIRGERSGNELNIEEYSHFQERWMTATLMGRTDEEANFKYLSRIGVNTAYLRGRRDAYIEVKHLLHYVRDTEAIPEISAAMPPVPDLVQMAQGAAGLADQYGMRTVLFLDEPIALPSPQSQDKEKDDGLPPSMMSILPPDMLGQAYCHRYRENHWQALSVFHPKVEEHYRNLIRAIMKMFPTLDTFYVYNEDAGASNINPPCEPYKPEAYPDDYDGYPWAAHMHLTNLIHTTAREVQPECRAATVTYHWYQPDEVRRTMIDTMAPGSVLVTLSAWDDSIDTSRLTDWAQDLCQQAATRPDLTLIADDDFNGTSDDLLMEITAGFPMALRTWRKLKTWAQAGAVGITQHHTGGPTLGINSITDLAWREFSWRPLVEQDEAEARILHLLQQQLGNEAGTIMLQAVQAIDTALDAVEDGVDNRPYGSRLGHSLHTFMFPPHLKDGLRRTGESTVDYCGDDIDPHIWISILQTECKAYAAALEAAQKAVELAREDQLPFHLPFPNPAMNCKEYASIMANAIEIVACFKTAFLNFMQAEMAEDVQLSSIWTDEIDNIHKLQQALAYRRQWMQSPYGHTRLDALMDECRAKIEAINRWVTTADA